ncbi:hypothetical protein PPACK8108_LOCUS17424 [Phakopsora pachyrhizi]|uniref:Zinc finger PHD-type domain-containing protein n=1 Tax=Phakopsora pachyrhizi TaxID=170000 RepID=A0AAV0BCH2_PHAPC|nr:hypothetical protein PPACK8108_LOCUS17424 [Phakopsora pachyrhizi]
MTSALDSDNSAVSKWGPKTRGKGKKGSLSAATSSELLEPVQSDDSTAIPVRKSRRLTSNHKVEKMLSQVDTDKEEDGEAAYFCQVQGSKRQVKLKESDLKHVPDLLRSFKSKKSESLASGEDDTSNFSRSKSLAKPASVSDAISSDSDAPNLRRRSKRQKKHYRRSSLSSTSDQTQLNPKNVCRSTRSSQSQPKYNFRTHMSSDKEDEEDELEEKYKSGRIRSQNQSKAVARKGFSPQGRKPCSEHHPDCTKCGIEFQPDLVSAWINADRNQKSKVRAGSLLDHFGSLEEVYAQGCWLECSNCSSSYHFGCLPADMKKDIAAQHKAERLLIIGAAHYSCLPSSGEDYPTDLDKIADYGQRDWSCADCDELSNIELENILAWRRPTIKKTSPTAPPSAPEQSILSKGHQRDDSESDEDSVDIGDKLPFNLNPDENADQKIPKAWLTPEIISSIKFDDEETIEDLDENHIPKTPELMYEKMGRAFIKWQEQSYAAENYMKFRKFAVPFVKSERKLEKLDARQQESQFRALEKQPRFIPNELMNFQLEGLNFCY